MDKRLDKEKPKTLDLLDELLYSIHSTRANVLEARARKYAKRLEKRKDKLKEKSRHNRGTFINETEADFEVCTHCACMHDLDDLLTFT
jgi:hypothetical protein